MNIFEYLWWNISSGDPLVIEHCDSLIKRKFLWVGINVSILFILSLVSSLFAMDQLFDGNPGAYFVAFFFSIMFSNLYLFLLMTIDQNLLVVKHSKGGTEKRGLTTSLKLRILFIIFMSLFVSKPLETVLFQNQLQYDLTLYKNEQLLKYTADLKSHYKASMEIDPITTGSILKEKISEVTQAINHSNYFIHQIRLVSTKHPMSWIFSMIVALMYMLPLLIKYYISQSSSYYLRKTALEKKLIDSDYQEFKNRYTAVMLRLSGRIITFYETHEDPPYNMIAKVKKEASTKSEEAFLENIYGRSV